MDDLRKFLFVDDDEDHRFFLAVAMVRTFPTSLICECSDSELAFITSRSHRLSAAVVHRATDMPGVSLVHRLRKENPELPIVFVAGDNAGRDRGLHAGATSVLHYDDWEKIGPLVEGILKCLPRARTRCGAKRQHKPAPVAMLALNDPLGHRQEFASAR